MQIETPPPAPAFSTAEFCKVLSRFATGVTIVTASDSESGQPVGLTVSSFNSVSLEPPLISWCLRKASRNLNTYWRAKYYNIHILSNESTGLAMHFAGASMAQRFEGLAYAMNPEGAPLLSPEYCASWLECRAWQAHEAGDHILFIGEVMRCSHSEKMPLVYHAGTFDLTPGLEPDV